jgi:hypothetical protein
VPSALGVSAEINGLPAGAVDVLTEAQFIVALMPAFETAVAG